MTNTRSYLAAAALLSSLAVPAVAEDAPTGPDWDMIAFEVKSWGVTRSRWQFTPQYGGYWAENVSEGGTYSTRYSLAFHTLEQDTERYIALEEIVRGLPNPAPDAADCAEFFPDQPYGTIRLTRGATTTEIAWQAGCMDEDYSQFVALLREMDTIVAGWGREVPVNRTEDFAR